MPKCGAYIQNCGKDLTSGPFQTRKHLNIFVFSDWGGKKNKIAMEKKGVSLTKSVLKLHFFVMVPERVKEFMFFRKLSVTDDTLGLFACGWVDAMLTS